MEDLIIAENETKQKLVEIINNSNLPAIVLEPMLNDLHEQLVKEKERQLQQALALKEQQKEKEKNKNKEVKEDAKN